MKLTRYGKKEWGLASVIVLILLVFSVFHAVFFSFHAGIYFSILIVVIWAAFAGFFRDPKRRITERKDLLLSPADGLVKDIELIRSADEPRLAELFGGHDMLRIGIFLSVFNVHINRAPTDMQVKLRDHKDGCYHDARDARAVRENESLLLAGIANMNGTEFPIAVKQISGAIARRIVCEAEPGSSLKRGEQYGMIKFGSRTEIYLPAQNQLDIKVCVGDKVQGGLSILAQLKSSKQS